MVERMIDDRPVLGSVLMVCAVFIIALHDSLVKFISGDIGLWQIFIVRGVIVTFILVIVCLLAYRGKGLWRKAFQPWVLLRSVLFSGLYLFYFSVIPFVDFGVLAASFYTSPVIITLLSSWFLHERIGIIGWAAVGLALIGVLCILQPGTDEFNALALMAVLSAICYAFSTLVVKSKCSREEPVTLVISLNFTLMAIAAVCLLVLSVLDLDAETISVHPFLLERWFELDSRTYWILAFMSVTTILSSGLLVKAYQIASPSIISVFDCCYIVFAVLFGMWLFSETLNTLNFIGIALIFLGGVLVLNKNRFGWRRKKRVGVNVLSRMH